MDDSAPDILQLVRARARGWRWMGRGMTVCRKELGGWKGRREKSEEECEVWRGLRRGAGGA